MKCVEGVWLPDHEHHLLQYAKQEGWTYQKHKLDAAMFFTPRRNLAVDIGGHCGLWSMHLVNLFDSVVAFEPVPAHRECYIKNVQGEYKLHPYALGNKEDRVSIHFTEGSSGDSWVEKGDDVDVKTLDSFCLAPDFIKIDTEGFEYFILLGGEDTVRTHRPTIVVEQKPNKAKNFGLPDTQAVTLLESWGYRVRKVLSGDYILTPD